jgi:hypothetical protein
MGVAIYRYNDPAKTLDPFDLTNPRIIFTSIEDPPPPPPPPGNLALLVTAAEVEMWRDRAKNGPYRVTGDVRANSPGHWTEMVQSSTLTFSSWRWSGPTNTDSAGRLVKGTLTNDPPGSTKTGAMSMFDAAVVAVVNNNTSLAQSVIDEIAWYAGQSDLDFTNRTRYPLGWFNDLNPLFNLSSWVLTLAQAYDVATVLATKNSTVEGWFNELAVLCDDALRTLDNVFPNRKDDSYTSRQSWVNTGIQASTRLGSGSIVYHLDISRYYNNRRTDMAGFLGFSGLLNGNATHISWANRYMREWVMFANRTTVGQETCGDHNRGSDSFPQLGFAYDVTSFGRFAPFMEASARAGDTSLYNFSSSEGAAVPTWGSNHQKSMKQVLAQRIGWVAGTLTPQYTGSGAPPGTFVAGDESYRIRSRRTNGNEIGQDACLLYAASYYKEPGWFEVVNRQGTPSGFTASPNNEGSVGGWRVDRRNRFLRSLDANPHGG